MKLFATAESIEAELTQMEKVEHYRRLDRATISGFFNGEPPLTDSEAEDLGLTVNVNNLFGYSEVNGVKRQLFSLFTKPSKLFQIEIDSIPAPYLRQKWEMEGSDSLNELLKQSARFKPAYEGVCGDAALHGEAAFMSPNATDWCPSQAPLSHLLVPDDAPAAVDKLTHWAIESTLTIRDIHRHLRTESTSWNRKSLSRLLKQIYKDVEAASATNFDGDYNPERLEFQRQKNSGAPGRRRPSVRVYYFYQVRADKCGAPVDLTIMLHRSETLADTDGELKSEDRVLYQRECAFDMAEEAIQPFFLNCTLGGVPEWHRVMGVGTLNYQLNHAVELLVNRAMQGTLEGMINLWQAKDGASREDIERILLKHNGVVPEGVSLVPQRFTPDLAGSLGMIQFFRQQGSKNAMNVTPNNGDSNNVLQVQAQYEQAKAADAQGAEFSNWYDYLDRLGKHIWSRLVNPLIEPSDPGYSDIKNFQARLQRCGIPLYWVQAHNVRISAVRVIGDGDQQRAIMAAAYLTQNRAMYGPKAQQDITRLATATVTGSWELAERLVPIEETPDQDQVGDAQDEGNTCLIQFKPPTVSDSDIDEVHFPTHLDAMVGLVQRGAQRGSFTPEESAGFQALGAHVVMHIQKKEAMVGAGRADQNKALARQWMQALNEVVSVAEKLEHNMQEKNQGQQPDATEIAKLQLDAQALQLQRDKFDFSRQKWARQQEHKEHTTAFQHAQALARNQREEMMAKNKAAVNDINSALKVAEMNKPEPSNA